MQKLNRFYRAEFKIGKTADGRITNNVDKKFTISYPYTLQLNTKVGFYSTSAQAQFKFLNIPPTFQKDLWKDSFERKKWIKIDLYAGYGIKQVLIFSGYVLKGYTYKKGGETDFTTELECAASPDLFSFHQTNVTLQAGTSGRNVYLQLLDGVPDCGIGYISSTVNSIKRATPYIGNTFQVINETFSKYNVFVDEQGLLNVLANDEVKEGEILTISAESGLLGSPRRQEGVTLVETLFEPNAKAGMLVNVLSDSMPDLNRTYQVLEVTHTGTISNTECGKLITKMWLSMGTNVFKEVKRVQEKEYKYTGKVITEDWIQPVQGKITSPYGYRGDIGIPGASEYHRGVDIGVPIGTDVKAPSFGLVTKVAENRYNGKFIEISHGVINNKDIRTMYLHLSEFKVSVGDTVNKYQVIAKSGNSGIGSAPHLDFRVKENNAFVNPGNYVKGYR